MLTIDEHAACINVPDHATDARTIGEHDPLGKPFSRQTQDCALIGQRFFPFPFGVRFVISGKVPVVCMFQ